MDPRRSGRTVIDPKVRQVGFFAPGSAIPDRTQSGPAETPSSPPASGLLTDSNYLSPVMIPPARHSSDTHLLISANPRPIQFPPGPSSPLRRPSEPAGFVGSYNPSDAMASEFFDDSFDVLASPRGAGPGVVGGIGGGAGCRARRSGSGKFATSLPSGGFELMAKGNCGLGSTGGTMTGANLLATSLTTVSVVNNLPPGVAGSRALL